MKILILGATGLVGSEVLNRCLQEPQIQSIIAPTRRELGAHPKLTNPIIDFHTLPDDSEIWKVDATICALGTTMKKARSKEAFKFVDFHLPLDIAKKVKNSGCKTFILNSAMGAKADSLFFYNQVKGELEDNLRALNFHSLYFVRPGLIGGEREEFRFGEESAKYFLKLATPIIPKKWQINPASEIAKAMVNAALEAHEGVNIIESSELT